MEAYSSRTCRVAYRLPLVVSFASAKRKRQHTSSIVRPKASSCSSHIVFPGIVSYRCSSILNCHKCDIKAWLWQNSCGVQVGNGGLRRMPDVRQSSLCGSSYLKALDIDLGLPGMYYPAKDNLDDSSVSSCLWPFGSE